MAYNLPSIIPGLFSGTDRHRITADIVNSSLHPTDDLAGSGPAGENIIDQLNQTRMPAVQPKPLDLTLLNGQKNNFVAAPAENETVAVADTAATLTDRTVASSAIPDAALKAATTDQLKAVKFSPLRFTVWDRSINGPLESSNLAGGLADISAYKGRYVLTFDCPTSFPMAMQTPIPITWEGKAVVVEKFVADPDNNRVIMQINIKQNPIPLLGLVAIAAGAVGLGALGLGSMLSKVDRVILDSTGAAVVVGVGFVAYLLFVKKRRHA